MDALKAVNTISRSEEIVSTSSDTGEYVGEMDPDEMAETVMNPETRTLKQITMEDVSAVNRAFMNLMGEAVSPRRQFIEENAWRANVDI